MLTTLRIKNLALVADLTLELSPGYNVITGETGAGKSMLIGALNLVLGERADRTLIRSGADSCSVEAVFEVKQLKAPLQSFLEDNGLDPCEDDQLVLKRAFSGAGSNRQFINGSPATLSALATVGEWLVDIHGPHEHQSLLHPARQLDLLDAFGKLESERESFAELVRCRADLQAAKSALIVDERTYAQQLDLLRFQVNEISAARLGADEETTVEQEHRRARNAARLLELSQTALDLLSEDEQLLLASAASLGRTLHELQRLDPAAASLGQMQEQAVCTLRELQAELSRYAERIDLDPARLRQLEERLNLLQSLKRKYGATIEDVLAFGAEAKRRLESLEQRDAELAKLDEALSQNRREVWRAGAALTEKRRKLAPALGKSISKQLNELGFKQSRFEVALKTLDLNDEGAAAASEKSGALQTARIPSHGFDNIEFQFAPNPGEPAQTLRAIASSGELARVMLAIKTVLAAEDRVPVLVFDEVDANVGGETANSVGEKMRQIARSRQVLCITHLPQVAAPASAHYVANKHTRAGRTISEITLLQPEERVNEIARMLGGQTEAARRHAEAMLKSQDN
jgi:DNA repair protein RecN (Recombination protein N)